MCTRRCRSWWTDAARLDRATATKEIRLPPWVAASGIKDHRLRHHHVRANSRPQPNSSFEGALQAHDGWKALKEHRHSVKVGWSAARGGHKVAADCIGFRGDQSCDGYVAREQRLGVGIQLPSCDIRNVQDQMRSAEYPGNGAEASPCAPRAISYWSFHAESQCSRSHGSGWRAQGGVK